MRFVTLRTVLVTLLFAAPCPLLAAELAFDSESHESADGYLSITWNPVDQAAHYRIEVTTDAGESWSKHRTEIPSLFLSGLPDGRYLAIVTAHDADDRLLARADQTTIEVSHHSRQLTIILFSIGSVVFIGIVFFIVSAGRARAGEADNA